MKKASRWPDLPSSMLGRGRSRLLRIATFAGLCLMVTLLYHSVIRAGSGTATFSGRHNTYPWLTSAERRLMDAAGNATLGFGSIQFINLPLRFDRLDAATLQAWLSGIDITEVRGVLADDINGVGMPPEHVARTKKGEKGCWRSHANIWSQMLRDKTPTVLVLESDAAWDVEVRDIMRNLNKHFTYLLDTLRSRTLNNPSLRHRDDPGGHPPAARSPDDPWQSTHWDLLSLGQCSEDGAHKDESLRYRDDHVAPGSDYWGAELGAERVVRRSGGPVCTTAYAISQTGAAKLLLRTAVDLDNPIDLVIRRLTKSGDLIAYSVAPAVFGQWEYVDGIGMRERGADSDIHGGGGGGDGKKAADAKLNMTGWEEVKRTGNVWRGRHDHANAVSFKDMALQRAWGLIIGDSPLEASHYNEVDNN